MGKFVSVRYAGGGHGVWWMGGHEVNIVDSGG